MITSNIIDPALNLIKLYSLLKDPRNTYKFCILYPGDPKCLIIHNLADMKLVPAGIDELRKLPKISPIPPKKEFDVNAHLALPDPNPALALFKSSCSNRVLGWLMFIERVKEDVDLIQEYQLGNILSRCAALIDHTYYDELNYQFGIYIADTAVKMMQVMTNHYFFKSTQWKRGELGLKTADAAASSQFAKFQKALSYLPDYSHTHNASIVFAKDCLNNQLWVARSNRLWAPNKKAAWQWNNVQQHLAYTLQDENLRFIIPKANKITMDILREVMAIYGKQYRCYYKDNINSPFMNINRIRGHFNGTLTGLHSSREDEADRVQILNALRSTFPTVLPPDKWEEIYPLFKKPSITDRELMSVTMPFKFTCDENISMSLCCMTCGEMKIALECCRELSSLSEEDRSRLPSTLGERLNIAAFKQKINQYGKIDSIDICNECHEMWPAYEALYWSIQKTGLNLALIEQLDSLLQMKNLTE